MPKRFRNRYAEKSQSAMPKPVLVYCNANVDKLSVKLMHGYKEDIVLAIDDYIFAKLEADSAK